MVTYDRPHSFNGGPMYSSTTGSVPRNGIYPLKGGTRRVVIKNKKGRKYTLPTNTGLHKACADAEDQEECIRKYRNKNTRKQKKQHKKRIPSYTLLGYTDYDVIHPIKADVIISTKIPDPVHIDVDRILL